VNIGCFPTAPFGAFGRVAFGSLLCPPHLRPYTYLAHRVIRSGSSSSRMARRRKIRRCPDIRNICSGSVITVHLRPDVIFSLHCLLHERVYLREYASPIADTCFPVQRSAFGSNEDERGTSAARTSSAYPILVNVP
jgi:hypothetical protein